MYVSYFGLQQAPFSIAPDPRYLFMSERHREALAHLLYGVESGGGFVLLTGEIGAGKTTVCRRFLEQVPPNAKVAYIFNPQLSVGDLLQTVCHEFGVSVHRQGASPATVKDHLDPLNAYLLQSHAEGQHNLLIIDEAQALSVEVLEQLRLLTNLETDQRKLLQIILIGQPELRQMLARPELEQLAQRVIARFHLGALNQAETRHYVAHRLGVAGWQGEPPFTTSALKHIHRLTGGVPRRINLLCDRSLLGAYASQTRSISDNIVSQAAQEVFEAPRPAPRAASSWRGVAMGTVIGAALTLGAALWWRSTEHPNTVLATPPAALAVSPAPSPPVQPVAEKAKMQPAPAPEATTGWPPASAWFKREDQAFAALSPLWGSTLGEDQPCAEAQQVGLQCYRTPRMTPNGLQQMDRPAALKLSNPGEESGYVLAIAMHGNVLELMDAQHKRWRIPFDELGKSWQGYYASLWRTPPGQQGRLNNGYHGLAAQWMKQRLSALQSTGALSSTADKLEDQVEAFQRAKGLEVKGIASPTLLMLINRASGVEEPRLLTTTP